MDRNDLEWQVREAFAGVHLGDGVSLRQAEAIDRFLEGVTATEFARLRDGETTDDWGRIPEDELRTENVAHLDAAGLRYYLPALLLWLLDHHDDGEASLVVAHHDMTVIGTLAAIAPISEPALRQERYRLFEDEFSDAQRRAIAAYVKALPDLVDLDELHVAYLDGATREYWHRYLPG